MSSSSSPSSSSSSSSVIRRSSKRKRVERVVNDNISETAIARRLGRRLRSMTQLLREDTPQASAILTNGINRIEPRIRNKDNNKHTTNIGDIIKSAGNTNNDDNESGQDSDKIINDDVNDVTELIRYNCYNRNNNTTGGGGTHPQLKFDESGNIVIEEVNDNKDNERVTDNMGTINQLMETRDESGQNAYKYAYKKSIGGKWSKEETNLFYKGLQLYGPDLMLISTVFGATKTTSQLRQKLKAEAKRNPKRLNEAIENKRTINLQEFEKAHGPITNDHDGGGVGGGGWCGDILSNGAPNGAVFDYEADLAKILEGCLH